MSTSLVKLSLFAGDKRVALSSPVMSYTPYASGPAHNPVAHAEFYRMVRGAISYCDLPIVQTIHTVHKDNYFGMAQIYSQSTLHAPVLCWQSSHNRRVGARLFLAAGIPTLNNLVITSELQVNARQVSEFTKRTKQRIVSGLEQFDKLHHQQRKMFTLFGTTRLVGIDAECSIIDMVRRGVINTNRVAQVIELWDSPTHSDLAAHETVWRLFNAVAHSYKPVGATDTINTLIDRSPLLVAYCKELVLERI